MLGLPTAPAVSERSLGAFRSGTLAEAERLLRRWSREPAVLIQSVVFPAFLLLVFQAVLGKTVTTFAGQDSLYGQLPLIALLGAMFGSLSTGIALTEERDSGLLARFWALPVHRAAGLAGRLLGEVLRTLAGTVILTAIGVVLGFRFHEGVLAGLTFLLVPMLLLLGFATMVIAFAVTAAGKAVIEGVSALCLLMLFFNSGFVPVDQYPSWLRPVIEAQPMSPAITAMRGLSLGGPVLWPLLQTVAWSSGLVVVFGALAVRGYRRAAER